MERVKKLKQAAESRGYRLGLLIGPLIIIVLAGILSLNVSERFQREQIDKFETQAHDALHFATIKLDNYSNLLYTGRAFVLGSQAITAQEWKTFYNHQSVFSRYPGVNSVAYVSNVSTQDLAAFEAKMATNDYFGSSYQLKDVSERSSHGLISVVVNESELAEVIGLDLTARPERYEVYKAAEEKEAIVASPPTRLATGYDGFFTVMPVRKGEKLDGYVLTSFRFDDLMKELFEDDSLEYKVTDVTSDTPITLYSSLTDRGAVNTFEDIVDVGGRRWKVELSKKADDRPLGYLLPVAILTTGIVMAMTLYAYSRISSTERLQLKK